MVTETNGEEGGLTRLCPGGGHRHGRTSVNLRERGRGVKKNIHLSPFSVQETEGE